MRGNEEQRSAVLTGGRAVRCVVILVALLVAGCSDSIDCCQDGASVGAITGVVVNGNQVPQAGVRLEAIAFQAECEGWVAPGPFGFARSDDMGQFEMPVVLFLMRPTQYCFQMVLAQGSVADTTEQLQVRSFEKSPPMDTTRLTLVVAW